MTAVTDQPHHPHQPHQGGNVDGTEYEDDYIDDDEYVRGYMLTGGRTRAAATELSVETLVSVAAHTRHDLSRLQPEHREIVDLLTEALSVAEVAAHLNIPLRAALVMTSEMVDIGTLTTSEAVDLIDTSFLAKIRTTLTML